MFSHVCCNAKLYKQGKVYLGWKWWDFSTCLQKPRSQHSEWMRLLQHEHPRATRADQTLKTSSNDVVALLHFDERRLEQTRLWAHPAGRQHDGQRWHTSLESIVLCITYVVCTYHNGKQWCDEISLRYRLITHVLSPKIVRRVTGRNTCSAMYLSSVATPNSTD